MWTGYLEIGGIEVADGERLRANIATGPCPSDIVRPMKCNTIAEAREALGELPPSFDRIEEAPWYDPAIPASGRLLGFDLMDGKGLGDTRRSVTALEGLGDGQTFTASRKQGREARFTIMVVALDQGALEYGRAWLSSILDGTRCGDEGGECGLFDVTWFAECPPSIYDFPPKAGDEVLAENLFTNPNLVGDGTWAEVRRNRAKNPRAASDAQGWIVQAGTGGAAMTTQHSSWGSISQPFKQATWGTAATGGAARFSVNGNPETQVAVSPGEGVSASVWVASSGQVRLDLEFYDSGNGWISANASSSYSSPGLAEPIRLEHSAVAPPNAAFLRVFVRIQSAPVGARLIAGGLMVGGGSDYFNGSTTPETAGDIVQPEDFRWRWLGAENASESVMEIEQVAGVAGINSIVGVSTKEGKPAARIIPSGSSTDSSMQLSVPVSARGGGTLLGTLHLDAPISGAKDPRARRLLVSTPQQFSSQAPDLAGSYPLRLKYSALTSGNFARWYHGGAQGSGDVWWTDIGLFAGEYDGEAFSGDSPSTRDFVYRWSGDPNNSSSIRFNAVPDPVAYGAALTQARRSMLDCSTISGPIEGELRDADSVWLQELEFTVGSELAGTYTDPSSAVVSSSVGPSPIVEFFRNLIENPRGIAASGNVEVGRNLITNPSVETNLTGWQAVDTDNPPIPASLSRLSPPSGLESSGNYAASARTYLQPGAKLQLKSPSFSVSAGEGLAVRVPCGTTSTATSPPQRILRVLIEWSGGTSTALSSQQVPGKSAFVTPYLLVTVPAGRTSARIVAEVSSVTPSQEADASVWMDAVSAVRGDFANPAVFPSTEVRNVVPIGGTSAVNDVTFAWAGTANASQTIIRYSNPARWESNGATTKVARINSAGRDAVLVRSSGGAGAFAGASMTLANVVPGNSYFPAIDARGWEGIVTQVGGAVRWLTSAGALISSEEFWTPFSLLRTAWSTLAGGPLIAPAGAARAEVVATLPTTARRLLLSNVRLNPTQTAPFFDGDTLDTPTREYAWEGARHASASTSTPVESTVVTDPLADPSCPPVPTPPRPPVVDESCGAEVQSWSRFFYSISSAGVPGALDYIPAFTIAADRSLDAARIKLLPNPEGVDPDALATDPVASWELSYLPANTPLTIDSLHREVTASISGQTLPADHLLTGVAGQPLVWPVLTCSQGYVLVIETPYQGSGGQIQPEVSVEGRVMYR